MRRRLACAALALLLGACASAPAPRSAPFWSGRLGLQVWSDPPQSFHAGFELLGSPESGELTLLSPVGGVLARLQWNAQQATLERGQQRWQQAHVDLLLQELTTAAVPISTLFEWLRGQSSSDPQWRVDLSAHAQGRIQAQRVSPAPVAELRIVLDR